MEKNLLEKASLPEENLENEFDKTDSFSLNRKVERKLVKFKPFEFCTEHKQSTLKFGESVWNVEEVSWPLNTSWYKWLVVALLTLVNVSNQMNR